MTDSVALTPTMRGTARRAVFWLVLAGIAVLVVLIAIVSVGGASATKPSLAADNPAPAGAKAVVEVLRDHGVTVEAAGTLDEARDTVSDPADTTVLFYDPNDYLTGDRLKQAGELAGKTVVVDPSFAQLRALAPGVEAAGSADTAKKTVAAGCDLPAAGKAELITASGHTYRIGEDAGTATGCFPRDHDRYSLVQVRTGERTVTVLGSTALLSNEHVAEAGNAALTLNLLGSTDRLVWYLPTLADAESSGPPSLGELTPGWVTPVAVLLIAAAAAAAIWRGRRFGPLVVENLPVTVKAAETMEGRARLYQRSSDRLHAADALRIGATGRLARLLGLASAASVYDVADAAASLTGRDPYAVRGILVDDVPATDADLMRLSDRLADLERDVAERLHLT